jgi:iron(III) transport system ATP-binding protein
MNDLTGRHRGDPPAVELEAVGKRVGDVRALDGLSVVVGRGTFFTLLGPSGCGKTTALRTIAGFERPDTGRVMVGGEMVASPTVHVPPEKRRVGMVFQDYALFPHLTVAANVGYGVGSAIRRDRVAAILELVGLAGLEDRMPHELSGGQQQRVALARALAPDPEVILLDEPFSNLDAALRHRVRREVKAILGAAGTTVVFVTHDQEEALSISDVVGVMREGRVVQAAAPAELYRHPQDAWIAGFLGDADFIDGHAAGGRVDTPFGIFATSLSGPVKVMIRPENVELVPDPDGDGVVADREYFGHDQLVSVALSGGARLRARLGPEPDLAPGQRVWVKVADAVTYPAGAVG